MYFFIAAFFLSNAFLHPYRVGDGSEYIIEFLAIAKHGIPWINSQSLYDYSKLFGAHQITGLVPGEHIRSAYKVLARTDGFDLNHFWFYSFLAALIYWSFSIVGISLSVNIAFLALHTFMFSLLLKCSQKYYGLKGIIGIVALYLLSPMIWYGNKIHTEFFTFILVSLATILVLKSDLIMAFFCLSIAGTQNISFSLVAVFLLIIPCTRVIKKQDPIPRISRMIFLGVGLVLMVIHPIYYLLRQSVIDPQFKDGGVSTGLDWHNILIWIVDPDIGLLPNWPFGIVLILFCLFNWRKRKIVPLHFALYVVSFIGISLYAQSSTTNFNSGATPGPARYGFWYIGLFTPVAIAFISWINSRKLQIGFTALITVLIGSLCVSSVWSFSPTRHENYVTPSRLSFLIQSHFSDWYNPNPQIFRQRYSIFGDQLIPQVVVGPDCRKVLVTPVIGFGQIYSPAYCHYSVPNLRYFALAQNSLPASGRYFQLTAVNKNSLSLKIETSTISFSEGGNGTQLLNSGWSQSESWGTWSNGYKGTIAVPCQISSHNVASVLFNFSTFQKQPLEFKIQNLHHTSTFVGNNSSVVLPVNQNLCVGNWTTLTILMPAAISPLSLHQSLDSRLLAVGAISFDLEEN